jgi:APA family basic amino acid/polyamine antiporter
MREDKAHISAELSRELSLFHITMMGLGMMIGAGVFIGIGNAIYFAGPGGVLLTFALNGVIALLTALSYAELSSAVPRCGGAYNCARLSFGRGTSFTAGWMEWFASSVAGSLYAVTFAIYTVRYFEGLGLLKWLPFSTHATERIVAFLIASFFLYINYRGASEMGKVGAFFTLGQTLFLIFIGLAGFIIVLMDPSRLQNLTPYLPYGWSKILITMGFTYVAFEGYEVIAQAGDEAIDPKRNLPKAMLYSVFIVTFIYVAVAFASIVSVKAGAPGVVGSPWEWIGSFKERGFGEAISRLMPFGNFFLTLAVIFASLSALNATIYSATRASYALGRDRMLPGFFASISRKRKTPWIALMFTGCLVISVAVVLPTMDVASSASIMFLFLFFLVNISVIKIRLDMGDELSYGFIMPFFPWLPILAIICQGILAVWLVNMSPTAWIIAPVWIISGIGIYYFYSKSRTVTTDHEICVIEEEEIAPESEQYGIMVAVANPHNALEMIQTTCLLSEAKNASVKLLHMVPVPEQVPLADAEKFMMEGKEGIVEAMLYLLKFPITTTILYCRNIARGIISALKEKKIDMIIMGWHGQPRSRLFRLGSTVDVVLERAPCNVVILRGVGNREFKRILVPLRRGPNSALALEVASVLAEKYDAEIVSFLVNEKNRKIDSAKASEILSRMPSISHKRIKTKRVEYHNEVEAILKEAKKHDLLVIGATREPLIRQITRDSVSYAVAREYRRPMIIVKAPGRISSWIKRWF